MPDITYENLIAFRRSQGGLVSVWGNTKQLDEDIFWRTARYFDSEFSGKAGEPETG